MNEDKDEFDTDDILSMYEETEELEAKANAKPAGERKARVTVTQEMEATVKTLIAEGKTGAEIATAIGTAIGTVASIKKKLGLTTPKKAAANMEDNDVDWDEDIDRIQCAKNALLDAIWENEKTKRFPDDIHKELVELEARLASLLNKL